MTVLDASAIARISRKAEQASGFLIAVKSGATKLALTRTTGANWASFANAVAEAEGKAYAWARLQISVSNSGGEFTEADVQKVALDMMLNGADDSWSGRGNDAKRARFDGVRAACSDMQWL